MYVSGTDSRATHDPKYHLQSEGNRKIYIHRKFQNALKLFLVKYLIAGYVLVADS